jgi:hypothetical protein
MIVPAAAGAGDAVPRLCPSAGHRQSGHALAEFRQAMADFEDGYKAMGARIAEHAAALRWPELPGPVLYWPERAP